MFQNMGKFLFEHCVAVNTNIGVATLKLLANYISFCDHTHLKALMLPLLLQCSNNNDCDDVLLAGIEI